MRNFLRSKKTKIAFLTSLIVVAVACFTVFFTLDAFSPKSPSYVLADFKQEAETVLNTTIEDNYYVNEDVNWPSQISIEYDGNTITASNGVILWPNGNATRTGSSQTLYQTGYYTVRYTYSLGESFDYVEKQVFVGDKLTTLSADGGSITAVTADEQVDGVFNGNDSNVTMQKDDALIVRIKEGVTFNYTKSIDLNNVDDNGLCTLISLDFHLLDVILNGSTYEVAGRTANTCIIRLSDAYDPSIYVDIAYSAQDRYGAVDLKGHANAKAFNQPQWAGALVAADNWGTADQSWRRFYTVDNIRYGVYRFPTPVLGPSCTDVVNKKHTAVTWKYDPENDYIYYNFGSQKGTETDKFLMPLKDARVNDTAFPGFTSNKVRLSIYMSDWANADAGRVDIFRIGDTYGEELLNQFKNDKVVDDVGTPVIDLGVKYTQDKSVNVAMNTDFVVPVPEKITGIISGVNYDVRAYVNYGMAAQFEVPIIDGKLSIDKKAIYTLEYSAMNSSGAVGKELLTLNVIGDATEGIKLDLDESIFDGEFTGGQVVQLPQHTLTSINIQDDVKLKITLKHEKMSLNVDTDTRKFTLPYSGVYKIVYEYSDNVYSLKTEFEIEAEVAEVAGFLDNVVIPKYFIKDASYTLPELMGYKLGGSTLTPIDVDVYVSFDGGDFEAVDRENVYIEGASTLQAKYVCSYNGQSAEKLSSISRIVDVLYYGDNEDYKDQGLLSHSEYFIHDNFTTEDFTGDNSTVVYTSTLNSGNNVLEFINAIDVTFLEFAYEANENANYRKINVKLVDYYDPTIQYVISIENVGGNACVSFNGAETIDTKTAFAQSGSRTLAYDLESSKLMFGKEAKTIVDLQSYFTTSLCYLVVELEDISGPAEISIYYINSQLITNEPVDDFTSPRISTYDFTGNYSINSTVTLYKPCVTDIITPVLNSSVTLRVMHVESGEYVRDINGKQLKNVSGLKDYTIVLDRIGEYRVFYEFMDGAMNRTTKMYVMLVVDTEAPTVEFDKLELTKIKIKTGTNIDASFTVSDNITPAANLKTSLWVKDLNSNVSYPVNTPERIITFSRPGRYMIYAFASDEAGNFTYKTVEVIVVDEV